MISVRLLRTQCSGLGMSLWKNDTSGEEALASLSKKNIDAELRSSPSTLERFLRWCDEEGIIIDTRLQIKVDSKTEAWSVWLHEDVDEGPADQDIVVYCPKTALLSVKTCTLFQGRTDIDILSEEARLGLDLAFCLVAEYIVGPESRFWGYLASLPGDVDLPYFWEQNDPKTQELLSWIKGTEVQRQLRRRRKDISYDALARYLTPQRREALLAFYRAKRSSRPRSALESSLSASLGSTKLDLQHARALSEEQLRDNLLDLFKKALCLVSSRAFVIDLDHGLALCPVADIFNHEEDNHVHLEVDDPEDEVGSGPHQVSEGENPKTAEGETLDEEANEPLQPSNLRPAVYMRYIQSYVQPGCEVMNSYGKNLSNTDLLLRYGFALEIVTSREQYTWQAEGNDDDPQKTEDMESLVAAFSPSVITVLNTPAPWAPALLPAHLMSDLTPLAQRSVRDVTYPERERLAISWDGQVSERLWELALLWAAKEHGAGGDDPYEHVRQALHALVRLCQARVAGLRITCKEDREEAFDLMEKYSGKASGAESDDRDSTSASAASTLLSVIRVAEQEYMAYNMAIDTLTSYIPGMCNNRREKPR